jgi:hypothetical protein
MKNLIKNLQNKIISIQYNYKYSLKLFNLHETLYFLYNTKMKKTMYGLLFGMLALVGGTTIPVFAQGAGGVTFNSSSEDFTKDPTDTAGSTKVGVAGTSANQGGNLITSIKTFINWVLGLLGLVALGLCLWAGFQMTTSAGDTKKFDEGKTILTNAAIGLAVIALSWLIVSLVFRVINNVSGTTA